MFQLQEYIGLRSSAYEESTLLRRPTVVIILSFAHVTRNTGSRACISYIIISIRDFVERSGLTIPMPPHCPHAVCWASASDVNPATDASTAVVSFIL